MAQRRGALIHVARMKIDPAVTNDEIRRGLTTSVRVIPPAGLLDDDLRRRIEAQQHVLAYVVASIFAAARVPIPIALIHAHRVIPPGWWFDARELAFTDARGRVSLVACGVEGVPLFHRMGEGPDHRWQGIDAEAWAVIAAHEACHAAHHLVVGFDAISAALTDPARRPGTEVEGFADFARFVHERITGAALPAGYDAARWPWRAPGLSGWLEAIAAAVLPFAVPPAPAERPCTEAEWLEAQRVSFSEDLRDVLAMREAAARWRAAASEVVP